MPTDWEIVRTMERYGGSFVRALADLCDRADPQNLAKIKATWPDYWSEYSEMARLVAAQRDEAQSGGATAACATKANHD